MGNHCIESEHLTIEDCCIKMHDRLFMVLHSSICWMVSWIVDSHCVMEHAGLFRVIVLVHLLVCSHVGLLKIVAFEIYQTESITMLKLGRGHGGDGDGIRKIKIKLRELCEVCGSFI